MAKLNTTELAELIGVTKQAVSKAARDGIIQACDKKGKKVFYDTEADDVKFYIETNPQKGPREKPSKKTVKKSAKKKTASKKVVKKSQKKKVASKKPVKEIYLKPDENYDDLSPAEINRRAKIADMRKKQMHVEILQKKFLPTDFVELFIFRYLEKLNASIERSAGVFITEIGEKILEAGEILPKHIESFVNLNLEAIDNTKKDIIKSIKKYEPKI